MAGVNHAEYGEELVLVTELGDITLGALPKLCNVLVAEAHLLCRSQRSKVKDVCFEVLFHIHDVLDRFKEVGGDLGDLVDLLHGRTAIDQLCNGKNVVIAELGDIRTDLIIRHVVKLVVVDVVYTDLKRTDALKQALLKVGTDAHDLTRCLHLRAEMVGCGSKLVEGEAGKLCDYIVKLRLECGIGVCDCDFLESHAYGDFSCNSCNGIARSL